MARTVQFHVPGLACRGCQKEIGLENYVLIQDKITRGLHHFHAVCAPKDPDLQRNHGLTAEPLILGMKGTALGSV